MNRRCKQCGFECSSIWALKAHYEQNPEHKPKQYARKPKTPTTRSASDLIHDGEQLIKDALKQIDFERDELHRKLLTLDDIAAKYKKVLNPNGTIH